MNINMIDSQVLTALRKAEYSDTQISSMTAKEVFLAFCRWEGLHGSYPDILWRVVGQLQQQGEVEFREKSASKYRLVEQPEFLRHIRDFERRINAGSTTSYVEQSDETRWIVAGHIVGVSLGRVGQTKAYLLPLEA